VDYEHWIKGHNLICVEVSDSCLVFSATSAIDELGVTSARDLGALWNASITVPRIRINKGNSPGPNDFMFLGPFIQKTGPYLGTLKGFPLGVMDRSRRQAK